VYVDGDLLGSDWRTDLSPDDYDLFAAPDAPAVMLATDGAVVPNPTAPPDTDFTAEAKKTVFLNYATAQGQPVLSEIHPDQLALFKDQPDLTEDEKRVELAARIYAGEIEPTPQQANEVRSFAQAITEYRSAAAAKKTGDEVTQFLAMLDPNPTRTSPLDPIVPEYSVFPNVRANAPIPRTRPGTGAYAGDNAMQAYEFLKGKGLSDVAAAGLVGNLLQESGRGGGKLDPTMVHDGGKGIGIAGWNNDGARNGGGRRAELQRLAAARGTSETDFTTQLEHLWSELNGPERRALDRLSQAKTPEEAAVIASQAFFRPGTPKIMNRIAYANAVAKGITAPSAAAEPNINQYSSRHYTDTDLRNDRFEKSFMHPEVLRKLDALTDSFGEKFKITSGYRDPFFNQKVSWSGASGPHTHGRAVDVDVSSWSEEKKQRFVKEAVELGYNQIGTYNNGSIHIGITPNPGKGPGGLAVWHGRGGAFGDMPSWAQGGIAAALQNKGPELVQEARATAAQTVARAVTGRGAQSRVNIQQATPNVRVTDAFEQLATPMSPVADGPSGYQEALDFAASVQAGPTNAGPAVSVQTIIPSGAKPFGELKSYERSTRDKVTDAISNVLEAMNMPTKRAGDVARRLNKVAEVVPPVKLVYGVNDLERGVAKSNPKEIALAAAGIAFHPHHVRQPLSAVPAVFTKDEIKSDKPHQYNAPNIPQVVAPVTSDEVIANVNQEAAKYSAEEARKSAAKQIAAYATGAARAPTEVSSSEPAKSWAPTKLSAEEETKFQGDFRKSPFYQEFEQRYNEPPDLEGDYDYRGWWKDSGLKAERSPHDGTLHGPSRTSTGKWLKAPDHPTAWKEDYFQKYGVDPDAVGATSMNTPPNTATAQSARESAAKTLARQVTGRRAAKTAEKTQEPVATPLMELTPQEHAEEARESAAKQIARHVTSRRAAKPKEEPAAIPLGSAAQRMGADVEYHRQPGGRADIESPVRPDTPSSSSSIGPSIMAPWLPDVDKYDDERQINHFIQAPTGTVNDASAQPGAKPNAPAAAEAARNNAAKQLAQQVTGRRRFKPKEEPENEGVAITNQFLKAHAEDVVRAEREASHPAVVAVKDVGRAVAQAPLIFNSDVLNRANAMTFTFKEAIKDRGFKNAEHNYQSSLAYHRAQDKAADEAAPYALMVVKGAVGIATVPTLIGKLTPTVQASPAIADAVARGVGKFASTSASARAGRVATAMSGGAGTGAIAGFGNQIGAENPEFVKGTAAGAVLGSAIGGAVENVKHIVPAILVGPSGSKEAAKTLPKAQSYYDAEIRGGRKDTDVLRDDVWEKFGKVVYPVGPPGKAEMTHWIPDKGGKWKETTELLYTGFDEQKEVKALAQRIIGGKATLSDVSDVPPAWPKSLANTPVRFLDPRDSSRVQGAFAPEQGTLYLPHPAGRNPLDGPPQWSVLSHEFTHDAQAGISSRAGQRGYSGASEQSPLVLQAVKKAEDELITPVVEKITGLQKQAHSRVVQEVLASKNDEPLQLRFSRAQTRVSDAMEPQVGPLFDRAQKLKQAIRYEIAYPTYQAHAGEYGARMSENISRAEAAGFKLPPPSKSETMKFTDILPNSPTESGTLFPLHMSMKPPSNSAAKHIAAVATGTDDKRLALGAFTFKPGPYSPEVETLVNPKMGEVIGQAKADPNKTVRVSVDAQGNAISAKATDTIHTIMQGEAVDRGAKSFNDARQLSFELKNGKLVSVMQDVRYGEELSQPQIRDIFKGIPKTLPKGMSLSMQPPTDTARGIAETITGKRKTFVSVPEIRDLPMGKAIAVAQQEGHLLPANEKAASGFMAGPGTVKDHKDLDVVRDKFDKLVDRGIEGRDWYATTRNAMVEGTANQAEAATAAKMHAVQSRQATPEMELQKVTQTNAQAIATGTVKYGMPDANTVVNNFLKTRDTAALKLGPKTGPYAQNLTPGAETNKATAVNDFRIGYAFGYTDKQIAGGLSDEQSKFIDYETANAVARAVGRKAGGLRDWTGEQTQASAWVAHKTDAIMADNAKLTEREALDRAKTTIKDFYPKHTAYMTAEQAPGDLTGHMPGMLNAKIEERIAYAAKGFKASVDPKGRDVMYAGMKPEGTDWAMRVRPSIPAQGVYTSPTGTTGYEPMLVSKPLVAMAPGGGAMSDESRTIVEGVEATRAALTAQNMTGGVKMWFKEAKKDMQSLHIDVGGKLDEAKSRALKAIGEKFGLPDLVDTGSATVLHNFGGFQGDTGKALKKTDLLKQIDSVVPGAKVSQVKVEGIGVDIGDDWQKGVGSGAVTDKLLSYVTKTPALKASFNNNPGIPKFALAKLEQDKALQDKFGAQRHDLQNLRQIIGEGTGWVDRLQKARKSGAVLPALAAFVLGSAVQQRQEEGGRL
jgi:hypothetical protein